MRPNAPLAAALFLLLVAAASSAPPPPAPVAPAAAISVITGAVLRGHTVFLADDLLEGRAPGTRGGELAAKYIAAQFARLGLEPAGDHGTYFQNVPMLGKKVEPTAKLRVRRDGQELTFNFFDDFVPFTDLEDPDVKVSGALVFVGYGVQAPEYRWDDYKGVDVRGKILLMLVNDPPATPDEPALFGGKALTYYGRWTYKYEQAARLGAAGAVLIHTPPSAGYPFKVVQSSWTAERFELPRAPGDEPPLALKSWVSEDAAQKIFALAGHDLAALQQAAAKRDFQPVTLGATASTTLQQKLRRLESANVVGRLPGRDAKLKSQYVVFTAHYDHLGIGKPVDGDAVYNGAADNAIGVAALLSIAEAMARATPGPRRSQVFAAVTGEEYGLLGSLYYARYPVVPLADTVANLNMDGLNTTGPTKDIVEVGNGKSELDEVAALVARRNGLTLKPDQFPEQGFFFRSDQFSLAKVGVPALYFDNGLEVVGQAADFGQKKFDEYRERDYHQPSDEVKPDWDWRGAEQMARFLFECGWVVSNWRRDFHWRETSEFRAARLESLKKTGR